MSLLTVLGSGTALPDPDRHSAAFHVDLGEASLLLDCGPGTLHGLASHGVEWQSISHVVISHYHNDHVGDLAALLFAMKQLRASERSAPLTLLGPTGFQDFLERLSAAMGPHVLDPGFEVLVRELGPGAPLEDPQAHFLIAAHPTPHTEESQAFRVVGPGWTLGYTGDTGPSRDVAGFLTGCEVLLAECALTDPPSTERHLSPLSVAELARIAAPDLLVLTHVYPGQSPEEAVAAVEASYQGRVVAARDGMRVELGPRDPS